MALAGRCRTAFSTKSSPARGGGPPAGWWRGKRGRDALAEARRRGAGCRAAGPPPPARGTAESGWRRIHALTEAQRHGAAPPYPRHPGPRAGVRLRPCIGARGGAEARRGNSRRPRPRHCKRSGPKEPQAIPANSSPARGGGPPAGWWRGRRGRDALAEAQRSEPHAPVTPAPEPGSGCGPSGDAEWRANHQLRLTDAR